MTLIDRLTDDMKAAMKSGDAIELSTLRMARTALTNKRIEIGRDLSDDDVITVLQREVKQRREAETQYRDAGRAELADKEQAEIAVLERYLPAQLADDELDQLVRDAVAKSGATGLADMGKVMGALMPTLGGRADGTRVSAAVRRALGA
ncbi:MAG: GatB/YqeY domain-containing protein [Patescibacteria group bacterium]|jgi:uncharacterized protein YqeY